MSGPPGLVRPPKPRPADAPEGFPTIRTMFRGLTKACPVCGKRRLFRRWFTMVERCPRCDLPFEREQGGFIGAIGANSVLAEIELLISLALSLILMAPQFPWVPLVTINVAVGLFSALFFYPIGKTSWLAISVLMNPPDIKEVRPQYLPGGIKKASAGADRSGSGSRPDPPG